MASWTSALTPEQELIRESARDLCRAELVPHAQAWDHAEELPRSLVGTLAEAGFLAAALPEELGGGGLDSVSYCLLCEELGKADSSVRGIVSVSNGLYGKTIAKWGSDEQRAEHLPGLASGEALGCYALTEPGCGSDAAALATRADRDGDDWLLTGSKVFITLGSWAATAIVFARSGEPGPRGITAFLVPTTADGFAARPMKGKLGLRAQDTAELTLDGVRVARLGAAGRGGPRLQGRDVRARQRPDLACRRLCRDRAGLPRRIRVVRAGARGVQAPDRRLPARPAAPRRDARRDGGGATADLEGRGARGFRAAVHDRGSSREVVRERGRRPRGERRRPGARRLRLRRRVSGRQVPSRRPRDDALRGHEPDPDPDRRPRPHRRSRPSPKERDRCPKP